MSITNISFPFRNAGKFEHLLPLHPKIPSSFFDPGTIDGKPARNVKSVPKREKNDFRLSILLADISLVVISMLIASQSVFRSVTGTPNFADIIVKHRSCN